MYREDTIAAISTPIGTGAIGVIRVSGRRAVKIAELIFRSKSKKKLARVPSHTVHIGYITERKEKSSSKEKEDIIDEVLVTVMRGPNSYTGEDVVEISCHGSMVSLDNILSLILKKGAKAASPGEFTKRAFLNGRLDLVQAEAIYDIISAKTDTSLHMAVNQLNGQLSARINNIRDKIVGVLAHIEASLDYPEEDIPSLRKDKLIKQIDGTTCLVEGLLDTYESGMIFREGLSVAIVGKANVGKSTLLNVLLHDDKAIVTPIAGTTRDIIEEWINIEGVPLKIMDTAGFKSARDEIEHLGIKRSKKAIGNADLVLFVIDLSVPLSKDDENIAGIIAGKRYIIVGNKNDLKEVVKKSSINRLFPSSSERCPMVKISALKGTGIEQLKASIARLFTTCQERTRAESVLVTNIRHKEALRRAKEALSSAKKTCKNGGFYEFIALELRMSLDNLGEITGEVANEDILNEIFAKFCVGK